MKTIFPAVMLLAATAVVCRAQEHISFQFVTQQELNCPDPGFGGISGMEYVGAASFRALFPDAKGDSITDSVFVLLSDHDPHDNRSYVFTMDRNFHIRPAGPFYYQSNIEALRYNRRLTILSYAFESKTATGVDLRYLKSKARQQEGDAQQGSAIEGDSITLGMALVEEPIPGSYTTANRGIEGITFDADDHLWLAFESGGDTSCNTGTVPFYKYKVNTENNMYDTRDKQVYAYPFERCSCMSPSQRFNGWIGSGVSEILALPGEPGKILVLERCFDGKTGSVKLYLASVQEGRASFDKRLVFDFNDRVNFDPANKEFIPDNIEAMSWGPVEDGHPTLYLMSDNNFRSAQKNQVIKLKMYRD